MIVQATPLQTRSKQGQVPVDLNPVNGDEYGTLVMDGLGKICSYGAAVEKMFGAIQGRPIGRRISDLIAGLILEGSSPSYNARYLVHLCVGGEWRKFEALDACGQRFDVELNVARTIVDGRDIFVLKLRLPGETPCR